VRELLRSVDSDGGGRLIVIGGREVHLTATEYAFLATLQSAPGRPRTRSQLLAAAGSDAAERAADVHIAQLRAKLGTPGMIRTIRGVGFALDDHGRPQPAPTPIPAASADPSPPPTPAADRYPVVPPAFDLMGDVSIAELSRLPELCM
jgi:DNA-binding winged helix-turn-helix (wHTH) protein